MRIFLEMEESEVSMIFDNNEFAYWTVTVERPLRLRVFPEREIPAAVFKNDAENDEAKSAIAQAAKAAPLDDWTAFAKATKLKAALLKKFVLILPIRMQRLSRFLAKQILIFVILKMSRLNMRVESISLSKRKSIRMLPMHM